MLETLGKKAGIQQKVLPHRLRHSYAFHHYNSNKDIIKLQKLLGHSFVSTTMIYADVAGI